MPTPQRRKPPQFSVQTLLIIMTGVALLCAVTTVMGLTFFALLLGLWYISAPVAIATLAAYCVGYRRTFFSAALFGWLATVFYIQSAGLPSYRWQYPLLLLLLPPIAAAGSAVIAIVTRRFLKACGWHLPDQENR